MIRRLVLSVVVALWVGPGAFGDDLLKEYGEILVGRWVGDVKLIAD